MFHNNTKKCIRLYGGGRGTLSFQFTGNAGMDALIGETEFLEFAITNFSEMMGYIAKGYLNIRIHKGITGEMWLGWIKNENKIVLDNISRIYSLL